MDRDQLRKQVAVLRRKRLARVANQRPRVKNGVLKLEKPLPIPQHPKQIDTHSLSASEIRRIKSEKILEQRNKNLVKIKARERELKARTTRTTGCGGCRRK